MALQYGFNITESDMKNMLSQNNKLQSGVRSWRQLFGNAALGYNAQSDALRTDYADAINQAYMSNYAQRNAIASAGLSAGSTQQLLAQNQNDLHSAYEQYVRNYQSDAAKVASAYGEEVNELEGALSERAKNFANLYNSAYRYLAEELYGSTMRKDDQILDYLTEHGLDWAYAVDENGNRTGQLLPWNQVAQRLFTPEAGLTDEGREFYDQMFNSIYEGGYTRLNDDDEEVAYRDFRQWLSDTDNDLYNWWISPDNFNYTKAGTNKGTANALLGLESTDNEYHTSDYLSDEKVSDFNTKYGGMSNISTDVRNSQEYADILTADKHVEEASDPRNQYSYSGAISQQKAYRTRLNEKLKSDVMSMIDIMDTQMSNYDAELRKLLGDNYSTFIESKEYGNLRDAVDIAEADISRFLTEGYGEFDVRSGEEYIAEYEKYLDAWKKTYQKYLDALQEYAKTRPTRKSSGF